jgi:lipopolysaccharide core galacturonosyltransferase RgtB
MIAALHDAVTGRRGFPLFLTLVVVAFWLLRVLYPDTPSNDDVKEQLWMAVDWRLGYGSGANPPLFTWLVNIVDIAVGSIVVSAEVVRFLVFWLFCFATAHVVRAMTGEARLAALAGLAPFAVYAIGWEAVFRHSNTMLLIASIPLTLAALLRLDRRDDWIAYLILAAVTTFGFYSKYNYAIVWIGFLGAALLDARLRARLLDRRMIVALLAVLLLLAPLLHWAGGHLGGMLAHGRLRLDLQPTYRAVPVPMSALADLAVQSAGLIAPLFAILLVLCPRAFWRVGHAGDLDRARWHRLLVRYLLIVMAILVAGIFVLGMRRFQLRYVYVLLPVLPLAFLRLTAAGFGGRRRQWLAAALVVVTLLVIAGATLRCVTYPTRKASAIAVSQTVRDRAI